jgi:uncharacterized protein
MQLFVKVIPKASRSEIVGWEGDVLKVRLKAVPEKGAANEELIRLLSREYKVAKSLITIVRGHTSRDKVVHIDSD